MPTWIASSFCASVLLLAACAVQGGAQVGGTAAEGSYQRFIVKYRAGTEPSRDTATARQRLAATAPEGLALSWERRLGVQADVFITDRALGAAEAEALMQRFRDDPDVEYIEPDSMMGIDPITRPQDLRREPG